MIGNEHNTLMAQIMVDIKLGTWVSTKSQRGSQETYGKAVELDVAGGASHASGLRRLEGIHNGVMKK